MVSKLARERALSVDRRRVITNDATKLALSILSWCCFPIAGDLPKYDE